MNFLFNKDCIKANNRFETEYFGANKIKRKSALNLETYKAFF